MQPRLRARCAWWEAFWRGCVNLPGVATPCSPVPNAGQAVLTRGASSCHTWLCSTPWPVSLSGRVRRFPCLFAPSGGLCIGCVLTKRCPRVIQSCCASCSSWMGFCCSCGFPKLEFSQADAVCALSWCGRSHTDSLRCEFDLLCYSRGPPVVNKLNKKFNMGCVCKSRGVLGRGSQLQPQLSGLIFPQNQAVRLFAHGSWHGLGWPGGVTAGADRL